MTDHQLFEKVLGFLQQTIVYSNEEMATLDELKKLVHDRLAQSVYASDMSEKHVHISDKHRHEFDEMVKKGTKAWDGTPDDWVDELRGGAEKHEFDCPRCGHCCRDGLERLCRIMGTFDLATGHADTIEEALDALELELRDVLGNLRARGIDAAKVGDVGVWGDKREWVGLDPEMMRNTPIEFNRGALWAERWLKEKNQG